MIKNKILINGKWLNPKYTKKYYTFSENNKKICSYLETNKDYVKKSIIASNKAFKIWSKKTFKERSKYINKIYNCLKLNRNSLSKSETIETGKTLDQAQNEIDYCIKLWKYASENCFKFKKKVKIKNKLDTFIEYSPVGTVVLIIPWNFPLVVLSERLPFILAAGCSVIIKPSEFAAQGIIDFIKLINKQGLSEGTVNLITGRGANVGEDLVNSKSTKMVSFTGSNEVGKKIYNNCVNQFKKVNLELGGKNKFVIFKETNLKEVAKKLIENFTYNAGQNCVAASDILVEETIYKKFKKVLIEEINKTKILNSNLSNLKHFNKTQKILENLRSSNINPLNKINNEGEKFFFHPRIYEDIDYSIMSLRDELFAPIITLRHFKNFKSLINILNHDKFGLAIYLWGKKNKILRLIDDIEVGRIWINQNMINFPNLPIGGLKQSGLNKEAGIFGIHSYSNQKTIIS